MFDGLFKNRRVKRVAFELYNSAVNQARLPVFYTDLGVPDTLEGRFDMISLHVFLVLRRLKHEGAPMVDLGQAVFDAMFADFDRNFREMGVGDFGVGNRVKKLARGFYGRVAAYDEGLEGDDTILMAALSRNVYRRSEPSAEQVSQLTTYFRNQLAAVEQHHLTALTDGDPGFIEFEPRSEGSPDVR
jgi:cytochrome b pre-mRNA-processing protein 3